MKTPAFEVIKNHQSDHWWFSGRARIVESVLMSRFKEKAGSILDVGAGFGGMIPMLKKRGEVEALEPYEEASGYLKDLGVKVHVQDIESFFQSNQKKYDIITLFDVLEHIKDDFNIFKRIFECLNPGGYLVFTVPAVQKLWGLHDEIHEHYRRYSKKRIRQITGSLFKIEKLSYYNFFLFPFAFLQRKFGGKIKKGEMDVHETPGFLNKILYYIFISEILFLKPGIPFPIGVSLMGILKKQETTDYTNFSSTL
jgi:SAM-dependent methyltransferase